MKRSIYVLLLAQFLTAFADNAILFTAVVMVSQNSDLPGWYVPGLQAAFLIAFVLLAPWVGPYADARPKRNVLSHANLIKAGGAALLVMQVEPLLAYSVVGIGAAVYGPAKYGILPELVHNQKLVKANSWIEGSTILAILSGTVIGAAVAEYSIFVALVMVLLLYLVSGALALLIKHIEPEKAAPAAALPYFASMIKTLFKTSRARYATLGVSLFWGSAVVLRVLIVAWAPLALHMTDNTDISMLVIYVAVGIALGSISSPWLIAMDRLRRARIASYMMGVSVLVLSQIESIELARIVLVLTGFCGGLFVVPINATLQSIGHHSVGSGGAVAVQHFFESMAMIVCTSAYAFAVYQEVDAISSMIGLGIVIILATLLVSWKLPPVQQVEDEMREHLPQLVNERE